MLFLYLVFQIKTYSPTVTNIYLDLTDNSVRNKSNKKIVGKAVFISDLHLHEYLPDRFLNKVIAKTNQISPDVLLLGGDYVVDSLTDLKLLNTLSRFDDFPKFGILGNHDYDITGDDFGMGRIGERNMKFADHVAQILEKNNIKMLRNENAQVSVGDNKIGIYGADELWSKRLSIEDYNSKLKNNFILIHNPQVFEDLDLKNASLVLSGHNHGGGQMKFSKNLSIHRLYMLLPDHFSKWLKQGFNKMTSGIYTNKFGLKLYLSRGIGMTTIGVRINCTPEITVINLVR